MIRTAVRTLMPCISLVVLSACVGAPPAQLANEGDAQVFTIELPPALAYRRVVEGARSCYERTLEVTADYFPDSQGGRISAAMRTTFAVSTALVVDINPSGTGTTVRIVSHKSASGMTGNVRKWPSGDYASCGFK
jgi:hypothetical protein